MLPFVLRPLSLLRHTVSLMRYSTYKEGEATDEDDDLYRQLEIAIKGNELAVMQSYERFVKLTCGNLGLEVESITRNRPVFTRLSLNKSTFIHKKHQRQYEIRTYYKTFYVDFLTGCTADVLLEYIQRFLPEGVGMIVTRKRLQQLPPSIAPPETTQSINDVCH